MPYALPRFVPAVARTWLPPLLLLALFALLELAGMNSALRYDRGAILAGQWWRLITGNAVHLGWIHLALNGAGLLLGWALFGDRLRPIAWGAATLWCSLAVGGGLLAFSPSVAWYVGFSGVLHGLFAIGAARSGWRDGGPLLLLLAGKLAWEHWRGDLGTAAMIGGNVVTDAHLYGFLAGLLFSLLLQLRRRQ